MQIIPHFIPYSLTIFSNVVYCVSWITRPLTPSGPLPVQRWKAEKCTCASFYTPNETRVEACASSRRRFSQWPASADSLCKTQQVHVEQQFSKSGTLARHPQSVIASQGDSTLAGTTSFSARSAPSAVDLVFNLWKRKDVMVHPFTLFTFPLLANSTDNT